MNLLELVAKVTLDKSEYEKGLSEMESEVERKKGAVESGMLKVVAVGTAALGAFTVTAVKTGAEFDQSMSQVAATMGVTVDEIQNLRDFAMQMGSTTVFSATQAAEALNYMALAGYDDQKAMAMLPTVLNLAAAGSMELARASDMVTDAESALGLTTEQTNQMVDQMARTASRSNTSVEQLGEAMLTIGGTANLMSGGTDRLATVLGILADNGIKGSEAGTHLRNMLLKLSSPTDDGAAAMKELGLNIFDSNGNMRDMQDIITDLNVAMSGLTDEQKIQYLSQLFNARDIAAVNALLGTSTERWNELGEAIVNSEGAAQAMAETQLDNLAGDVTLLKSAFEGLQIDISDKLTPAFRNAIQFVTQIIENMETIGPIVLGVAAAFTTLAVAINIGKIVKSVTTSVQALFAVLSANPIALVVAAIAGLVTWFVTAYNTSDEFRAKVDAAWEKIKSATEGLVSFLKAAFDGAKVAISASIDAIKNVIESLREKFSNVWNKIKEIVDKLKKVFDFKWELPKIKLPHFKISGSFSLSPPSIPHFSVEWYKKAYENPYMFTKPTVMGFGDGAGGEIIYGHSNLLNDIREVTSGEDTINALSAISSQIATIIERMQFEVVLDDGTLVGKLAPKIDVALSEVSNVRDRGVSLA